MSNYSIDMMLRAAFMHELNNTIKYCQQTNSTSIISEYLIRRIKEIDDSVKEN